MSETTLSDTSSGPITARTLLRGLASMKLAVALLAGLAIVLAAATFIEAARGSEYAQWHIYKSPWFVGLLGLLAVNILAATLVRFPWRQRVGFLITHLGLLVLLGGAIASFWFGVEGSMVLMEGGTGDSILLTDRTQASAYWQRPEGRLPAAFVFRCGPSDWPESTIIPLGEVSGIHLEVLKFIRHAEAENRWLADPGERGVPAIRCEITMPDGKSTAEHWLLADRFGAESSLGMLNVEFQCLGDASLLDDWLNPPACDEDGDGVLAMHHQGKVFRIPVRENLGKTVPVGDGGITVELLRYLPDAQAVATAKFESKGDKPNNPVLELQVRVPDKEKPIRQIAFAQKPFLSMDGIHGWSSPVKFWFHHPAVKPQNGAQLVQASDGKLYHRVVAKGECVAKGPLEVDDAFELGTGFRLAVREYLPHARREVTFVPAKLGPREAAGLEAAALLRVSAGDTVQDVWLKRDDPEHGMRQINTSEGGLLLKLGYDRRPLGFSVKLKEFRHELNPGSMESAAFTSVVRLVDRGQKIDEEHEISMNQPLTHEGFTFYQSGFKQMEGGASSGFIVAYDPGRFWKYLGSLMICGGAPMIFLRGRFGMRGRKRSLEAGTSTTLATAARAAVLALVLVPLVAGSAAAAPAHEGFDFAAWRQMVVLHGGRQKPLDTMASENFRALSNRTRFTDPETGAKLDATALYLHLLLSAPAPQETAGPHGAMGGHMGGHGAACGGQKETLKPDHWDRMPLLLVGDFDMHQALGIAPTEKYVAPADVPGLEIALPSGEKKPFLGWAMSLMQSPRDKLSGFEQQAADLADRYQLYRDLRRGRGLEVLPATPQAKEWLPVSVLLRGKYDDKNDPEGQRRAVQAELVKAREAYLADDPEQFNSATTALLAVLREYGAPTPGYLSASVVDLELLYNHWAPFRIAWICMAVAVGLLVVQLAQRWAPLYALALTAYGVSLAAMVAAFAMRMVIAGRAPVTNMYESVVYVALGVAIFGLIFEWFERRQFILCAAAVLATITLVLADTCPAQLDGSIKPLPAVLRNNFWLAIHVLTITLSYATFALAYGVGNIVLSSYLRRSPDDAMVQSLTQLTHRLLQVGVFFLALGTVLGAVWADFAWGRFWSWDPKEVWALIALIGYIGLLHARYTGWINRFGLAAGSVCCFSLVIVAWYGVNFVMGTGLHSYGSSSGGLPWVLGVVGAQAIYVLAVAAKVAVSQPTSDESPRIAEPETESEREACAA